MRHNIGEVFLEYAHIPVMQNELVHFIESSVHGGTGVLVDCTIGEGGHSELFLSRFADLRIIAMDRDAGILEIARQRLKPYANRIDYINDNFCNIALHLDKMRTEIRYLLYDFGISSYHLERSGRGFAFAKDEKLDMRLDDAGVSAYHVVNKFEEKALADIIHHYGEERWARKIAAAICLYRRGKPIATTSELSYIVLGAIPKKFHVRNIHPATRVFQALRIYVNDELAAIGRSLNESYNFIAPGGRIMAISFHSLEDRIVKEKFRRLSRGCTCDADRQNCQCTGEELVKILTKKPLRPQVDEIKSNSRARSARLRVCEKGQVQLR
jgi:16S rRNA (cytosine1402-N4)-methyltransferase